MDNRRITERHLRRRSFAEGLSVEPDGEARLAIVIPGIRTDASWIDGLAFRVERWTSPIKVLQATPDRVSSFTALSRLGIRRFKKQTKDHVTNILINHPSHRISIIAHSMGCAILSEILEEIDFVSFDLIIFLGSICRRDRAMSLRKHGTRFINHVGRRDVFPVVAEILNPLKYSATGSIGFNQPYCSDEVFDTDHFSCTRRRHIESYVVPLLYGFSPTPAVRLQPRFSSTMITYWKRGLYSLGLASIGVILLYIS